MSWHTDLRNIDWNGRKYAVLDKIKEEGRTYLGLATFDEVSEVTVAMDAGRSRPLPAHLIWVEEVGTAFIPLPRKTLDLILKRKSDRALEAFRKK